MDFIHTITCKFASLLLDTKRSVAREIKDGSITILNDYSPTTMYNDYSINQELFHWQSQSTTTAESVTGQRYIHHREQGSKVLLFVREFKTDRVSNAAAVYTCLGTANYVSHEGSRPMNIIWKLDNPIPARCMKATNKLMVG